MIEGKQKADKEIRELVWFVGKDKNFPPKLLNISWVKYGAKSLAKSKESDYTNGWWNLGKRRTTVSRINQRIIRKWWNFKDWMSSCNQWIVAIGVLQ